MAEQCLRPYGFYFLGLRRVGRGSNLILVENLLAHSLEK
jgi:hypothetical protein